MTARKGASSRYHVVVRPRWAAVCLIQLVHHRRGNRQRALALCARAPHLRQVLALAREQRRQPEEDGRSTERDEQAEATSKLKRQARGLTASSRQGDCRSSLRFSVLLKLLLRGFDRHFVPPPHTQREVDIVEKRAG